MRVADERARELWAIWRGGLDIAPRLSVDAATLQAYLAGIGAEVERPPRDAALSIAEGKVLPAPAEPGQQALADATAIDVLRALETLEPQTVFLRTRTLDPRLTDAGIAPAVEEARELLSGPLVLKSEQQTWMWEPSKLAELLAIRSEGGRMTAGIDPERLQRAVEKLAQGGEPSNRSSSPGSRPASVRICSGVTCRMS